MPFTQPEMKVEREKEAAREVRDEGEKGERGKKSDYLIRPLVQVNYDQTNQVASLLQVVMVTDDDM